MTSIPYLLNIDGLDEKTLKKFNILKKTQDSTFVPLKHRWEIRSRPEVRADTLWSSLVPHERESMSPYNLRYVLVPLEMAQYVDIREYDGTESYSVNYSKYGIQKIQEILANTTDTDKLSAIQEVINKVIRESNK